MNLSFSSPKAALSSLTLISSPFSMISLARSASLSRVLISFSSSSLFSATLNVSHISSSFHRSSSFRSSTTSKSKRRSSGFVLSSAPSSNSVRRFFRRSNDLSRAYVLEARRRCRMTRAKATFLFLSRVSALLYWVFTYSERSL